MLVASGLTRSGPVSSVMLFMPHRAGAQARIIYLEEAFGAVPATVFAAFEAQLRGQAIVAREADALLTVQFPMPEALAELESQRTVLTLTCEAIGDETRLTLTHAGFGRGAAWDKALDYFARGWPAVLAQMKHAIANASPAMGLAA